MKRQNKLVTYTLLSLILFLSFQIQPTSSPAAPTNTNPQKWFKKPQYYGALGLLIASGVNVAHLLSSAKGRRSVKALFQKENGRWKGFKNKAAQLALLRLGLSTAAAAGGVIFGGYTYASGKKTDRPESQTDRSAPEKPAITPPTAVADPTPVIEPIRLIPAATEEPLSPAARAVMKRHAQLLLETPPSLPTQSQPEAQLATESLEKSKNLLMIGGELLFHLTPTEFSQTQDTIIKIISMNTVPYYWNLICNNPDQTLLAYMHNMQLLSGLYKQLKEKYPTITIPAVIQIPSKIQQLRNYFQDCHSSDNAQVLLKQIRDLIPLYPLIMHTKIEGTKPIAIILSKMLDWINQTLSADDTIQRSLLNTVFSALNALTPLSPLSH